MIVFSGRISDKAADVVLKECGKISRVIAVVVDIIMLIPITILAVAYSPLYLAFIIPLIVLIPLAGIKPKDISLCCPDYVSITEEDMYCESKHFKIYKGTAEVTKIIDAGDYYMIYFGKYIAANFTCQKNLLTEGTIEEFEAIFEGKIVKAEDSGLPYFK